LVVKLGERWGNCKRGVFGKKKPPTLKRRRFGMNMNPKSALLGESDINCIHAFFAASGFESDGIAFANFVDQATNVDKNFLFGRGVNDETKAFGGVEKFYCSGIHCKKRKKSDVAMCRDKCKGFWLKNWLSINFEKK